MLSREELDRFTGKSKDPEPRGLITRPNDNVDLTDEELRSRIIERNPDKPTYLLRREYERRLRQRGL